MTNVNVSYYLDREDFGKCDIELPSEMVAEVMEKFQKLFSEELKAATFTNKGANTLISFYAKRKKIQLLEEIMIVVTSMTARLN